MANKIDGRFRNKKLPFVQIPQDVARHEKLSLRAKGLYLLIQSYITIPNFNYIKVI